MRGSVVLFGSTQQNRQLHVCQIVSKELDQKLNWNYLENYPDIKIVEPLEEKKSIGIAQIRESISFLQEKPLALPVKILVVSKAHIMTDEAQNALLKTLEEPPEYALILLLSKTEGALLPTVLSRCRKIKTYLPENTDTTKTPEKDFTLSYVLALPIGNRLDWAEEKSKEEKDTIIDMLENWIEEGRAMLKESPQRELAQNIEKIIEILDDLENTNVGMRFALEQMVINI